MNILFDNIIYSLQTAGGISVVWTELLKKCLNDNELIIRFIESSNNNIFRKSIYIEKDLILENPLKKFPNFCQRYMNVSSTEGAGIFHSSYYRLINDPKYVNVTTVHDFTYEYYIKGYKKYIHHKQKGNAISKSKKLYVFQKIQSVIY